MGETLWPECPKTPLVGWLVALPQVELDTTLADVSRIPLNNAHNVSLTNCKRQMTSSLVQCAGCRCLDRRPVSRTSLPKRRPTLRSKFHVCFLRLHGHLRACLSSKRLPLHASTLPKVYIEVIGAPNPLPHCAFPPGCV